MPIDSTKDFKPINVSVLTISDTRTEATDKSGQILAKKIKEVVEFEGQLDFDSTKPDGNPRKLLDSSTINKLGWSPEVNLDNGLRLTYKWYLNNL